MATATTDAAPKADVTPRPKKPGKGNTPVPSARKRAAAKADALAIAEKAKAASDARVAEAAKAKDVPAPPAEAAPEAPSGTSSVHDDCPICGFHFSRPKARCSSDAACAKRRAERDGDGPPPKAPKARKAAKASTTSAPLRSTVVYMGSDKAPSAEEREARFSEAVRNVLGGADPAAEADALIEGAGVDPGELAPSDVIADALVDAATSPSEDDVDAVTAAAEDEATAEQAAADALIDSVIEDVPEAAAAEGEPVKARLDSPAQERFVDEVLTDSGLRSGRAGHWLIVHADEARTVVDTFDAAAASLNGEGPTSNANKGRTADAVLIRIRNAVG